MIIECKGYGALCGTETFRINGIKADETEFGEKYDDDPYNAPDYGCGNMKFHPYDPVSSVMEKYGINETEWYEICDKLDEELSFGRCGWCI